MTLAVIIMSLVLLIAARILLRKRRNARKIRTTARRRARQHHRLRRTVKTRGVNLGSARTCPACGDHAGRCRHLTRRAEHAEGFLGKLKD
jgi:hypothetical protein